MVKKARLGLYLEDEEVKRQIKIAAARKGISTTAYCAEAIKERLVREGELSDKANGQKRALLARINELRQQIGPVGMRAAELVREGRRR
ncbi:MAG: hypothetical protein AB1603_08730 [Chloroflexota bacterium]